MHRLSPTLICFFWFHDWVIYRKGERYLGPHTHFSPLAGADAFCKRCGKLSLDADHTPTLMEDDC